MTRMFTIDPGLATIGRGARVRPAQFIATLSLGTLTMLTAMADIDPRGSQFIGIDRFDSFKQTGGPSNSIILTSPVIDSAIPCDELVVSWNVLLPDAGRVDVDACALYAPDHRTKYFTLSQWSADPKIHPRQSVLDQKNGDGDVQTDTLVLRRRARQFQLRLTFSDVEEPRSALKFIGLNLLDKTATAEPLPPNTNAWGKLIDVVERSQMPYPDADGWCSPTTLSMLLAHWSVKLNRPEMNQSVPDVARAVYDPNWPGTGNWALNVAYAGSFRGMRAYVTRLSDVSELEDWIAAGIPVGVSVCYNRLRGKSEVPSGHLVVCVGFTENGDVIVNDPGTTLNVRKNFPRENLIRAWAYSQNTVYLVYPEPMETPEDRFGHWH